MTDNSHTQPRALAPRKLEQTETLQSLNQWRSVFKNYFRRCQFYGYFSAPGVQWDNSANRGFTTSETRLSRRFAKNSMWYDLIMPIGLARVLVLSERMNNCARPTGLARIFVLSEAFTDSAINALLLLNVTIAKMGPYTGPLAKYRMLYMDISAILCSHIWTHRGTCFMLYQFMNQMSNA